MLLYLSLLYLSLLYLSLLYLWLMLPYCSLCYLPFAFCYWKLPDDKNLEISNFPAQFARVYVCLLLHLHICIIESCMRDKIWNFSNFLTQFAREEIHVSNYEPEENLLARSQPKCHPSVLYSIQIVLHSTRSIELQLYTVRDLNPR